MTEGARFIGNYMEASGFSAIAAKSVVDFVCQGNVIVDGATSAQNDPTSGAIYYTPGDHAAAYSRPRAVITGNIVANPGGTATTKQNGISIIGTPTSYATEVIVSDNVISGCGKGIWLDYVRDVTIDNNTVTGGTGGVAGVEDGIVPNHVVGTLRVTRNRILVTNGYGFVSINGMGSANLIMQGNLIQHTSVGTWALLARGSATEVFGGNTIDSTTLAVSITTDGTNNVGALAWDRSNIVLGGGTVSIDYNYVTRLIGNIQPVEYTPYGMTNVSALWDTSYALTQSAGKATTFADRVGNFSFSQPTDGNRPAVLGSVLAARPALRFDGLTSWMSSATTLASILSGPTSTLYLVVRPITVIRSAAAAYDNDGILCDTNGVWGAFLKNVAGLPNGLGLNHGGGFDSTPTGTLALLRPIVFAVRHAGGRLDVRVNAAAWTGNVASTDTTPLTGGLRLGAGYDNSHFANFDLGAIVVANGVVSPSDDYRILRYAQTEFGVSF